MRDASQRETEEDARLRALEGATKRRSVAGIGRPFAALYAEAGTGVAERAGDPDVVARLRGVAAQRNLRRHASEHGDAQIQRPAGGVAADQIAVVAFSQREEAIAEGGEPCLVGF